MRDSLGSPAANQTRGAEYWRISSRWSLVSEGVASIKKPSSAAQMWAFDWLGWRDSNSRPRAHHAIGKSINPKKTKKFCCNSCRVKFHRIKHGHPLVKPEYNPFEMIQCRIENCPNCGTGLAKSSLKAMGCVGLWSYEKLRN